MIERFADEENGGFFETSSDHEQLVARRKDLEDHPIPAGNSSAAYGLLRLGGAHRRARVRRPRRVRAAASARARAEAPAGVRPPAPGARLPARAGEGGGAGGRRARAPLERVVRDAFRPHLVLAGGEPDGVPLLEGRDPVDGRATAYVCEQFACRAPVTEPDRARGTADLIATVLAIARRRRRAGARRRVRHRHEDLELGPAPGGERARGAGAAAGPARRSATPACAWACRSSACPGKGRSRNVIGVYDTPRSCLRIVMAHTDSLPPAPGRERQRVRPRRGGGRSPAGCRLIKPGCDVWLVATGAEERGYTGSPDHLGALALARRARAHHARKRLRWALSLDEVGRDYPFWLRSPASAPRADVEGALLDAAGRAGHAGELGARRGERQLRPPRVPAARPARREARRGRRAASPAATCAAIPASRLQRKPLMAARRMVAEALRAR